MKVGALLEKLLKKAGVEITDELRPITEIDTEMSEDVAKNLDKSLLTVAAAKSHPEVNKVLRQSILGVADEKMDEFIIESGLTVPEDFATEKNSYEKMARLLRMSLDHGKKSAGSNNKQTADEFAKKEAEYNKAIKTLNDTLTEERSNFAASRENDLIGHELEKKLLTKDFIFPAEMATNVKLRTALSTVQDELSKKSLSWKRNEDGSLSLINKDGQPAYNDSNEPYQADTFIDGVLAQNKLLKINDPNQHQPSGSGGANPANGGGNPVATNQDIMSAIDSQLEMFKS